MPSAFLSYSSKDKEFVRRLADALSSAGVTVWLDETHLRIGDSLVHWIGEAIREVDFVIVVVSRNSLDSPWVGKELDLAILREITQSAIVVLPVRLDDSPLPAILGEKFYADFRDPLQFDHGVALLLTAMNVKPGVNEGLSVEWVDEGPRIAANGTVLSSTESNALLIRWFKWYDKLLPRELKKRGAHAPDARSATRVKATLRACSEMYKRTLSEAEARDVSTEYARKCDLFFRFMERMHFEASRQPLDFGGPS